MHPHTEFGVGRPKESGRNTSSNHVIRSEHSEWPQSIQVLGKKGRETTQASVAIRAPTNKHTEIEGEPREREIEFRDSFLQFIR